MGSSESKNNNFQVAQNYAIQEALKNFNIRINSYSYPQHGPYSQYIEWCRSQYELECIPQSCRYGNI
jgi:hypothetical protein